jgi:hypothetical protein
VAPNNRSESRVASSVGLGQVREAAVGDRRIRVGRREQPHGAIGVLMPHSSQSSQAGVGRSRSVDCEPREKRRSDRYREG